MHKKLETAHLVTYTEEILNGKLHFLCSVFTLNRKKKLIAKEYSQGKQQKLQTILVNASKTFYCHFHIQKTFEVAYLKYLFHNAQSNQKYKEPLYKIHVRSSLPDALFKRVILNIFTTLTETWQWSLFLRWNVTKLQ